MASFLRPLAGTVLLGLAYFALTRFGLVFVQEPEHIAVIWPAVGLAVASLLRWDRWRWQVPGLFVAGLAAQLVARDALVLSAALATLNTIEPLLIAAGLRRGVGPGHLPIAETVRGTATFVVLAVAATALCGAAGAALVVLAFDAPWSSSWLTWWLADGLGVLTLTPLLLARGDDSDRRGRRDWGRVLIAVAGTAAVFLHAFGSGSPMVQYPYAAFPLLLWVAVAGRARLTTTAVVAAGVLVVLATVNDLGPFARPELDGLERVLATQGFLAASLLSTLLVGAVVSDRRRAEHREHATAQQLESVLRAATEASIIGTDLDGRITVFNVGAERMLGHPADTVVGHATPAMFHDPAEVAARAAELGLEPGFEVFVHAARRGEAETRDWTYVRADGRRLTVSLTVTAMRDGHGRVAGFMSLAEDVTDHRATVDTLRTTEADLRAIFHSAAIEQLVLTADDQIERSNAVSTSATGHPVTGPLAQLVHRDDVPKLRAAAATVRAADGSSPQLDVRCCAVDGEIRWTTAHLAPLAGDRVLLQLVDVTERRQYEQQLQHMADHDALTGLLNRRRFELELERHVEHVRRYGDQGSVVVLDIDHFKQVNDTLGHNAGDELIVSVAQVLRSCLRQSDVLARLGGDEFAVLLPRAGRGDAGKVAGKLVERVRAEAARLDGTQRRRVTISVGVTQVLRRPELTGEELLVEADLAMYDAKDAGRDQYAFFTDDDHREARTKARLTWMNRIEHAIATDSFALLAQPIVDLRTRRVSQHELLLRLVDERDELVPPGAFLYVAERYGLVDQIDRWVARQAIETLARLEAEGRPMPLEVNVSGRSLGSPELLSTIEEALRDTRIDPRNLIFEITETAAVADVAVARSFAEHLEGLGCRFALDDFGAGFGSFYYLKHLPSDYLKIDGEFVRHCVTNDEDRMIVQALVQLARGMGKQTIAEFVGDDETAQLLAALGVDFAQGYHLGMPVPIDDALCAEPDRRTGPLDRHPERT